MFCENAVPGTKWCEMRNAKKKTRNAKKSGTKYTAINFLFFAFCVHFMLFRDKCIAGPVGLMPSVSQKFDNSLLVVLQLWFVFHVFTHRATRTHRPLNINISSAS